MSTCKSKDQFATVEDSTKSWMRTNGYIDSDMRIVNEPGFDQAHSYLNTEASKLLEKKVELFNKTDKQGSKIAEIIPEPFAEMQKIKENLDGMKQQYEKEDKQEFQRKVDFLQKGMNVKVVIDEQIESSRVLGKNDPRTIEAGIPVIVVNPNQLFTETAFHEFGHIFVDSFPKGLDNPRIIKALNQLRGTALWTEVRDKYSDQSEQQLHKEILTTAIGRQAVEIWDKDNPDNSETISAWENFKNWFVDFITRTFGLNQNEIENLTREMMSTKVERDLMENLSETAQELRAVGGFADTKGTESKETKQESSVELVYSQIQARISTIFATYNPNGNKQKLEKEAARKVRARARKELTSFEKIKELKDLLEDYKEKNMVLGLSKYTKWSKAQVGMLKAKIARLEKDPVAATAEQLQEIKVYNSAFGLFDDMEALVISLNNKGELSDSKRDTFLREMSALNKERNTINKNILAMQRAIYAEEMVKTSNFHLQEYQLMYGKQWDANKPQEERQVYINRMMTENADMINDHAMAYYEALSEKAIADISVGEGLLINEKDISNTEIQVISRIIDLADQRKTEFMSNIAQYMKLHHDEFAKTHTSSNMEEKYKNFIEKDANGHYSLLSQYKPEFVNDYMKLVSEANDPEAYTKKYGEVEVSPTGQYVYEGKQRQLLPPSGKGAWKVNGEFYEYKIGKTIKVIPIAEAIAQNELRTWRTDNTKNIGGKGKPIIVPIDSWENERFNSLNEADKKHLEEFESMVEQAEELFKGNSSLIKTAFNAKVTALPGITKSSMENIMSGDMKALAVDKITDIFKKKADEHMIGEESKADKLSRSVFADVTNKEKLNVPIPFRQRLSEKEQSLDLHSILFMNIEAAKNYQEKKDIEATLLTVIDVMGNRLVPDYEGLSMIAKMHGFSGIDKLQVNKAKDKLPEDVKKAMGVLENRIYGIKEKAAGEVMGVNIQKGLTSYLKYASGVALMGNYLNSIINATSGTAANLIEAASGETYNMSDWKAAEGHYWGDVKNIMSDMGSNVETSRTNLMMNFFNVMGASSALNNRFSEDSKFKSLMTLNSLRILDHGGEHMMQGKTMYAILHSVKVLNAKGEMITKDGTPTKDKKQAMTLNEGIKFEKDSNGVVKLTLDPLVEATSFSPLGGGSEKILLETRGLIKKKIIDLYGLHDEELKAQAQREWWGKMLFFLRKWVIPGAQRRYRGISTALTSSEELRDVDKFYSEDLKQNQEGYYVTAIRFVATMVRAIKAGQVEALSTNYNNLSNHEKANMKRLATEIGMISLTLLAYAAVGGLDDEPDEDMLVAQFLFRRELAELSFFVSPKDAMKTMSTPAATVGIMQKNLDLLYQFTSPTEMYETGVNKDRYKLSAKFGKIVPFWSAAFEKDLEAALRFQQNN